MADALDGAHVADADAQHEYSGGLLVERERRLLHRTGMAVVDIGDAGSEDEPFRAGKEMRNVCERITPERLRQPQ